jgi:uncharacterized membrane protein
MLNLLERRAPARSRRAAAAALRAVRVGRERTFEQDPKYPIRLLVDVAVKALSSAINDPTTAVQTIDQLEDLLRRLGASQLDAGYAADENGVIRLVFRRRPGKTI